MKTLFEKIYTEQYENVLTHINMNVKNLQVAEDLTSEVFIKVLNNIHNYDEAKATIPTWVRFISNNIIIDHHRTNHYGNNVINSSDFNNDEGIEEFQFITDETAEQTIYSEELSTKIANSFNALKPKYRKVANLYFMKEKTYKEVAEILEIPMGSVKGMISRCRDMLQSTLTMQEVRV